MKILVSGMIWLILLPGVLGFDKLKFISHASVENDQGTISSIQSTVSSQIYIKIPLDDTCKNVTGNIKETSAVREKIDLIKRVIENINDTFTHRDYKLKSVNCEFIEVDVNLTQKISSFESKKLPDFFTALEVGETVSQSLVAEFEDKIEHAEVEIVKLNCPKNFYGPTCGEKLPISKNIQLNEFNVIEEIPDIFTNETSAETTVKELAILNEELEVMGAKINPEVISKVLEISENIVHSPEEVNPRVAEDLRKGIENMSAKIDHSSNMNNLTKTEFFAVANLDQVLNLIIYNW